jgi:hypothetical protein
MRGAFRLWKPPHPPFFFSRPSGLTASSSNSQNHFSPSKTETSLYERFLALTDRFSLISHDMLVIPVEKPVDSDPD